MKKIVIIIAVCAAAYMGFFRQGSKDYQGEPYVHIYGRDSCSLTQNMKKELRAADIHYEYYNIDDRAIADPMHKKMRKAGIDTRRYMLPVVEVNGAIKASPASQEVKELYQVN